MDYTKIVGLVLALCIGGLFADLIHLFVKVVILFAKVFSKEWYSINFAPQIWVAGILATIIALCFIFA